MLANLFAEAPDRLFDRVAARWSRVPGPGPIGELFIAETDEGIAYVRSANEVDFTGFSGQFHARFGRPLLKAKRPPAGLLPALRTGKAGDIRFDLRGLSSFERRVLRVVQSIQKGQVRPYAWVAQQIGQPKALRAVGSTLGRNPVPVLIPCHRVVRSDGSAGGYVFGTPVKRRLLEGEGTNLDEMRDLARHGVHYLGSDTTGVVCFPSCPNARRITVAHRRGFRTVAAAQAAGYRTCLHCRPTPAAVAA
jgi:O-6-methylguanine DNA methyltransferase